LHCVTLSQKLMNTSQAIHSPAFCIILLSEQQSVAKTKWKQCGILLMNVCIGFVMFLKLYIFSAVTHSRRWWVVVMAWQLATLPMLCYIIIIIIIINITDWTLWPVPSPQLLLFAPTLLRSSNYSHSLCFCGILCKSESHFRLYSSILSTMPVISSSRHMYSFVLWS